MKVILLQDIANIGRKYDVVEVASGHALNFLIPNGKARHADDGSVKNIENKKDAEEKEMLERQREAMEKLGSLEGKKVSIFGKANEEGHLFAKINEDDIKSALEKELALEVRKADILIDDSIKEVGEHKVRVKIGDEEREVGIVVKSE